MADVLRFRDRVVAPRPPRGASTDELAAWHDAVDSLQTVGMLEVVRRRPLIRFVQVVVRLRALEVERQELSRLERRLRLLRNRTRGGRDRATLLAAIERFTSAWCGNAEEWARLAEQARRFRSAHRLTPLSRRRADVPPDAS